MAVHDRSYRRYEGALTGERWRFLILPRYAFRDVFRSRLFTAFFALCFVWPLVCAILIYLRHNAAALQLLGTVAAQVVTIDAGFFYRFLNFQGAGLGFLIVLIVGPSLVAPDLRNNGLALYLCRPFSRTEYVVGKMTVLVSLLSAITWVPGLLLFLLQAYLEGTGRLGANLRIAAAIFVASWVWILLLSLLALAVSATVKWKPIAAAALVALFFVAAALGSTLNQALGMQWGHVLNLALMIETVWAALFGVEFPSLVPVSAAWVSLSIAGAAALLLLARKLRAYEVVR